MSNLNTGFYKDLDTNFEQALKMSDVNFSHEQLISMLINGNIPEKQIAALKLECLKSKEEAGILVFNLTGCDGKIREAVALKIRNLLYADSKYLDFFTQADIFADASIDINGNICRLVIDSVALLKKSKDFSNVYTNRILTFIKEAFKELDSFIFRDKKYVINKQLFKLYWSLEALKIFANDLPIEIIFPILERASKEREYTIREKAAQILVLLDDEIFKDLKFQLQNDENYYVRNAIINS